MSKALYRKYRSKSLDEVIGQKHITDILSRAISKGKLSHAYLLSGPRGVGKTSVARILAHEINGITYDENTTNLDIIEIDAASNNGVEDVRELREKVQIAPFSASKKVYIIDEVHMLSKAAFNALLKTIEEPPDHVVFILATTNVEKLPATIVSRVQRFSFRPISVDDAVKHLSNIAKKENINITDDALRLIAERSDGSFRDSISLLDQLSSIANTDDKKITSKLIEDMLGLAPNELIVKIVDSVENRDLNSLVELLDGAFNEGVDNSVLASQITSKIRQQISQKPQLIPLLDALIDVSRSPQPQLKLISVLGMAASQKQQIKSVALLAPVREVSATISELQKQAILEKPSEFKSKAKIKKSTSLFEWEKLIDYTRKNHIALFSVLSKCNYQLEDSVLSIYTNNRFYKKKLDDNKYSSLLNDCLNEIGSYGLDVHTIATNIPPTDSQAAAVAVIMGGGVEVSLESA
ncbi:MAG: DNA polymerase III subunit gamma/tau [Candidatus Saccharibacteria bacterium]